MVEIELRPVVDSLLRRAQRQGFVVPREVREELMHAGRSATHWRDVIEAARGSLHYRQGRYYYLQPISPRLQEQQSQQQIVFHTARELIRRHQAVKAETERRQQDRIDFIYPVKVMTEDGRQFRVLTRDLSPSGIRLLTTRSLLGQKVQVHLAPANGGKAVTFVVRILWSCAVGDDLFENGGSFIGLVEV
jgi:hypothetical protein